jgi:hypothetical protein
VLGDELDEFGLKPAYPHLSTPSLTIWPLAIEYPE